MSDITIPRLEVVNGHTDVICSTSIRHILAVRKSTLLQIDTLIRQLAEISVLTESIGGKTARDWAMKQDFRCGCWLMEKPETAMKAITRNLDREIWRDLMQRSGMLSLMDAQARDTWNRSLEYDNFPEISKANILSTFEQLHRSKDEVFERGVINVFRGLSWKECCICSAVNRSPTTGGISPLIWMTTYSPFRVKRAMKMRCSASDTLRRTPRISYSENQNWLIG